MRTLLAVLTTLCLLAACKRDPEVPEPTQPPGAALGTVKLTVVPVWNGGPFDKNVVYHNAAGQRVQVQVLKFYLAPLNLLDASGEHQLFEADLFDVVNGSQTRVVKAPISTYSVLRFGVGLPEYLNHGDITLIDPNAPLGNNSGMYWTWATMYRFALFEGRFDTLTGATGPLPYQFAYHTGMDTLYRRDVLPLALEVDSTDTARITLQVDVARFFTNGTDTLDLTEGASFHGEVSNLGLGIRIADLERDAFRLP
ncbi:MAG TPA: MbnP family protein [Flavobacteriales bacterium]|jgi:hypothetical protein|nr:MbnP family protein [Flavobacteriales bacterium]